MSVEAITWAAKQEVGSPAKKLVLLVLANWASDEGITFPSHKKVARVAELTPERVRVLVRELEAEGYLRRVARYRTENGRGQLSNQYQLLVGGGCQRPGGVVTSNQGGVGAGNHPMNTKEIDTKEDTKAASPSAPEEESENPSPPVKKKGAADFPNTLRFLKEETHRIYQELRPDNWVDHRKPPKDVEPVLREALAYADGNQEEAAEVVRAALTFAKNDDWWNDPSKNLSMANILRSGRVITFAEKQWAEEKSDTKRMVDVYDLTIGNPREKVREISKRVSHTRDASEQEWQWADDDSKARFIRPGRAYHVTHAGPPGTPGYVGLAEVLRIEQIYVVMRTPDGEEIRTHVSNLGRESYERDVLRRGGGVSEGASRTSDKRGGQGDIERRVPADAVAGSRRGSSDAVRDEPSGGAGVQGGVGVAGSGVRGGAKGTAGHRTGANTSGGAARAGAEGPELDGGRPVREVSSGRARSGADRSGGDGSGADDSRVREGGGERGGLEHAGRQPDRGNRRGDGVPSAGDLGRGIPTGGAEGGRAAGPADNGGREGVPQPGRTTGGSPATTRSGASELPDSGDSVHLRPDRPEGGGSGEPGRRGDVGESGRDDGRGGRRHPLPRPLWRHDSGEF